VKTPLTRAQEVAEKARKKLGIGGLGVIWLSHQIETAITESVAEALQSKHGGAGDLGGRGGQESPNAERSDGEAPGDAECRCGHRESEHEPMHLLTNPPVPFRNVCNAYRCACNRFDPRPA